MNAKERFEQLGYVQKIYENQLYDSCNGIQYVKKEDESRMQYTGMIRTDYIEFYHMHKEIVIYTTYEHRNGNTSKSDSGILNLEKLSAIQKQVDELEWQINRNHI